MTKDPEVQFLLQNGYAKRRVSSCSEGNTFQIDGAWKIDKGFHL